jgi:hypothetical protein
MSCRSFGQFLLYAFMLTLAASLYIRYMASLLAPQLLNALPQYAEHLSQASSAVLRLMNNQLLQFTERLPDGFFILSLLDGSSRTHLRWHKGVSTASNRLCVPLQFRDLPYLQINTFTQPAHALVGHADSLAQI